MSENANCPYVGLHRVNDRCACILTVHDNPARHECACGIVWHFDPIPAELLPEYIANMSADHFARIPVKNPQRDEHLTSVDVSGFHEKLAAFETEHADDKPHPAML